VIEPFGVAVQIGINEGPAALVSEITHYIGRKINNPYNVWLRNNQLTKVRIDALKDAASKFAYKPKISIIMPVFNTKEEWLRAAVESITNQVYSNLELCISDDASTETKLKKTLEDMTQTDDRIKIRFLETRHGISATSNAALSLAGGEFVGFLDHDDELSQDALYEVVRILNRNRRIDVIYTDEDKIDLKGKRVEPFFKPDWSPDLLLSMNYISHFTTIRKHIVDEVGGFRAGFEGSQDYDLLLRVTERTNRIEHIQKPLYHWRKNRASTAADVGAKPYTQQTTIKTLNEALARRKTEAETTLGVAYYRAKYKIRGHPLISIIIPTRNNLELLRRCVESITHKTTYRNYEIIIVDNESSDPETLKYLDSQPHKVLRFNEPFNFSRVNNYAAKHARGEHLLFLNNDTEIVSGEWLEAMLEHSQRPEVGMVGCTLLYPARNIDQSRIQHAGAIIGVGGVAGHAFKRLPFTKDNYFNLHRVIRNCSAVTAACTMIRRRVFNEFRGFDEHYRVAFGDIDLCLRLRRKGYLIVYTPYSILFHHESASRGPWHPMHDEDRAIDRWSREIIRGDKYYNPNLTSLKEDYSTCIHKINTYNEPSQK